MEVLRNPALWAGAALGFAVAYPLTQLGADGPNLSASPATHTAEIAGRASVIDGDTLDIHGKRIRLYGVDAPESAQTCTRPDGTSWRCGQTAALKLDEKLQGAALFCAQRDIDRYGRLVATCMANGEDISAWLVSQGYAVAYRRYSPDYVSLEDDAKKAKRGIWNGSFMTPSRYRTQGRAKPQVAEAPAPADRGGCNIKGNINGKGEHIYHVPGGTSYGKTSINDARGERWFCSETDAIAAGWRPAKG